MYITNRIVLPTRDITSQCRSVLAGLSNANYSLDDILHSVVLALDIYVQMDDRRRMYIDQYSYDTTLTPEDQKRYKDVWMLLYRTLENQYRSINLWDENGIAWCSLEKVLAGDIVLIQTRPEPMMNAHHHEHRSLITTRLQYAHSY